MLMCEILNKCHVSACIHTQHNFSLCMEFTFRFSKRGALTSITPSEYALVSLYLGC